MYVYVTGTGKTDRVGTLRYFAILMLHNFLILDSSLVRFTQEVRQGNSYIAVNNQKYVCTC